MKKLLEKGTYIMLLLLVTIASYGQTYQNPTYGTITTKTAPTTTADPYVSSINASGVIGKVAPENIPVNVIPPTTHYTPTTPTLKGHFQGIDNAIGNIPLTTAGNTTRVWFTGDATTITAGTFYLTNPSNKGTVANVSQSVINDDNQKKYFTQDLIGQPFATATLFPPGVYAGNLSASTTPNSAQQRFTVELYKCNNAGTPIASGVSGAPVGDLGVTVILILDSGLLTLADGSVTNVPVSASLASQFSIAVGERIRYHVSAEKVGTASSNITESVWYGSSFNSFLDVPTPITSSGVSNASTVGGATVTNALDNLNIANQQLAGAGVTYGHINDGVQTIVGVKTLAPTASAVAGTAKGMILNPSLTAIANNDVLSALDLSPTFTNGVFTGVKNYSINVTGNNNINGSNQMNMSRGGTNIFTGLSSETNISTFSSSAPLKISLNGNSTTIAQFFGTTGNLSLQSGGTFTDGGFRLDVSGSFRARETNSQIIGGTMGGTNNRILIDCSIDTYSLGNELRGLAYRGTSTSKTATLINDQMLGVTGVGQLDSSTNGNGGAIQFTASENWSLVGKGTDIRFLTVANASTTISEKTRMFNSGRWAFNSVGALVDNGVDQLQVTGSVSATVDATTSNQLVRKGQLDLKANLASPAFTGTPTAPTATAGTNTTQIATTAFVVANSGTKSLYELFTDTSNTTTSLETLSSYTLTAGTLQNNGDRIEFYTEAVSSVANVQWIFSFGSNDFSAGTQVSAGSMATRFTIIRTSATTIRVVNNSNHIISDFTVSNMDSTSNIIALKFLASSAGGATLKSVNYDYKRKSF